MKYSETDLTEATKILSYLRSMQIYAVTILCASLLYLGLKIYNDTKGGGSGPTRTPVPESFEHLFRSYSNTDSGVDSNTFRVFTGT